MKPSIQKRLFGILVLFVLALTLLWAGLSLMLAYIVEDEIIDRVLISEIAVLQQAYLSTGEFSQPMLPEVSVYADLESAPEALQTLIVPGVGGEIFTPDKTHYHYRWLKLANTAPALLVAEVSPWLVVSRMSAPLLILLLAGFAVALLFSLVAAFYISRMTTRPLRELTQAIEQEPRPSPLPHVAQGDEVGVLAAAMEAALASLQLALERETTFTRDVSHELRTPLTSLRNAILLLPDSLAENEQVEQLATSSAAIESLLTTLLALARAESSITAALPIRAMIEGLLLDRATLLESESFDIELHVPDRTMVQGNEQITQLLLGNLIDNAIHYAAPARLSIRIESDGLTFANPINASARSPHAASLGHGLSLVRRLASTQGWTVQLQESADTFSIRLNW
ncbi:sensor histidine kinase [Halioglobus maricola]|nr:HAMP domain-containing sensor histidine kinase [Halioglobus maricola]